MTVGRYFAATAALLIATGIAIDADSSSTPTAAIFVANLRGYVTVYSLGSNGDVAPISTIDGAATLLGSPRSIAVDSKGNIFVISEVWNAGVYAGDNVVVFSAGSKGNASPIAIIAGPHTSLRSVHSIALDSSGKIYVGTSDELSGVAIFAAGSNGDVRPDAIIAGSSTRIQNAYGIAIGLMGSLFVANVLGDTGYTGVLVFPGDANGNVKPSVVISGTQTGIDWPAGVALDSRGNIYVANAGRYGSPPSIRAYSAGSNGNVPPIATISGSNTGLNGRHIRGISLDSKGNLYVTNDGRDGMASSIIVFKAGSTGNVKPIAVISGDNTRLSAAVGIAIGPYPGIH
jgi:hypothetical protein